MILKSYIVEKDIGILEQYHATLVYGENEGIKTDIKAKLKNSNQGYEIFNFFEEEVLKNKNILIDIIINESLFSEKKIIFIHNASDKIYNEIVECIDKNKLNIKIFIFSENLDKKSKLRNLFEKTKNLAVFACYKDNDKTLINYINTELAGFKGLTGEMVNLIMTNSDYDRQIIHDELIKIKGFFVKKLINQEYLLEILNIKNDTSFEEIRDSALRGQAKKVNKLLSEIDIQQEDSFYYLNSLNYRILKLLEIQKISKTINNYEKTLENLKPAIFWKDKPIYLEQLRKWNLRTLNKISSEIGEAEILMKKNSTIRNDVVIKNLIITVTENASTSF